MRNLNKLSTYVQLKYNSLKERAVAPRIRSLPAAALTPEERQRGQELLKQNPNLDTAMSIDDSRIVNALMEEEAKSALTPQEGARINRQLEQHLIQHMKETPRVSPEKLVQLYQIQIPSMSLTYPSEQADRERKRSAAAASYAKALVIQDGYLEDPIDTSRPRQEQISSRLLSREERIAFQTFHEEHNEKAISELFVKTIESTLNKYDKILSTPLTDDALIRMYPDLILPNKLMMEAHKLLKKARENQAITEDQYQKLYDRVGNVMDQTQILDCRMVMMADPYYPTIRLEVLQDCPPGELIESELYQEDDKELVGIETVSDILGQENMSFEKQLSSMEKELSSRNTMLFTENVLSLGGMFNGARKGETERRLAEQLGVSLKAMRENMVFCDSNGNITKINEETADQLLTDPKEVLYVLNKTKDDDPVPVFVDKATGPFTLLVGSDKIQRTSVMHLHLQKPSPLRGFSLIANWLSQTFLGRPTETMRRYEDALARFNARFQLKEKANDYTKTGTPKAVQDKQASYIKEAAAAKREAAAEHSRSAKEELTAAENSRIAAFGDHLDKLVHQEGYEHVVPAAREVLKNGSPESRRRLSVTKDETLLKIDKLLKNGDPDALQKGLDAFVEREKSPEIQRSKSMELSSSDQPEITEIEAPKAEHSGIPGPINV